MRARSRGGEVRDRAGRGGEPGLRVAARPPGWVPRKSFILARPEREAALAVAPPNPSRDPALSPPFPGSGGRAAQRRVGPAVHDPLHIPTGESKRPFP